MADPKEVYEKLGVFYLGRPYDLESGEIYVSEREWQTFRKGRWKSFWSRSEDRALLVDLPDGIGGDAAGRGRRRVALRRRRQRLERRFRGVVFLQVPEFEPR